MVCPSKQGSCMMIIKARSAWKQTRHMQGSQSTRVASLAGLGLELRWLVEQWEWFLKDCEKQPPSLAQPA